MGLAPSRRSPQQSVADRTTYVSHGPTYVSVRTSWLFLLGTPRGYPRNAPFLYYRDQDILDENALDMYRRGLACFEGNAPTYHLALREHPVIVWDFHSLMLTVKFLFSVKLTDEKNPMRMCEHCRMAFYAHRADSRYCSADCRNKAGKKP